MLPASASAALVSATASAASATATSAGSPASAFAAACFSIGTAAPPVVSAPSSEAAALPRPIGVVNCVAIASAADFVRMIVRNFSTSSRFSPPGVTARTSGRFRDARATASSRSAEHDQARSGRPRAPSGCPGPRGSSPRRASARRPPSAPASATRAESADASPAAASSCGRSLWYERGCGPKTTPPPVQCGARRSPWRARPVPFWRHILCVPPRTSPRVLVSCGALALVGQLRDDRLVHDRPVRLHAEHPSSRSNEPTTSPLMFITSTEVIALPRAS